MTELEYIAAAESRRKKRERELLLLLLLLINRAARQALAAYRHSLDYPKVIDNVLSGNPAIGMRGATPIIAAYALSAHTAGAKLAARKSGYIFNAAAGGFAGEYQSMAARLAAAIADAIRRCFFTGATAGQTMRQSVTAIRNELAIQGYTADNPFAVESGVERLIVTAFNFGVFHFGLVGTRRTTGFRHISVLDDATTDICTERANLTLPVTHPYWRTNWPSLHFRCRSLIDTVTGAAAWSANLPLIPPLPGFGAMPQAFIDLLNQGGTI